MRRAAGGDHAAHDALEEILIHYWYPLYAWARRRGLNEHDAADGVQNFLALVCEENLLARASEQRGRLRSWLLTCFQRHLAAGERKRYAQKRGGGAVHLTIDWTGAESLYASEPLLSETPEALYARTWAVSLMEEAMQQLTAHYECSGRAALFRALLPALESPLPDNTYAGLAAGLGMTPGAVRTASVRLRQRYRRILLDLAAARLGISSEAALEAELRSLLGNSA